MQGERPELVLPAGSMDALRAAVFNGADAVYCGTKKFNARGRAENFSMQQLRDAADFCHLHGKRIYLALNTLLKDSELREAIELAKEAYCIGVDAVIVQDLGLAKALGELLPGLALHASTQMTCHNSEGALFLERLGFRRIVLARELLLQEISAIKERCSAQLECFVHGALCFSYSGQCLFSSFLFGKSGNRGQCLQPCRLAYTLQGFQGGKAKNGYFFSMKDLVTVRELGQIAKAGISAFKVEGRQKGVEYVASVARAYRAAMDAAWSGGTGPSKLDIDRMKIAFLRQPTRGYLFGEKELVSSQASARQGMLAAEVLGFAGKAVRLRLFETLHKWARLSVVKGDVVEEFSAARIVLGKKEVQKAFRGQVVSIETGRKPFLQPGQQLFFTSSRELKNFAYSSIRGSRAVTYDLQVSAKSGRPLEAVASLPGKKVTVTSNFVPEASKTTQTTGEMVKGKLMKSSDFFLPGKFSCTFEGNPFLPLSELKKFKSRVIGQMREALFSGHRRRVDGTTFLEKLDSMLQAEKLDNEAKSLPGGGAQKTVIFCSSLGQLPQDPGLVDIIACHDSVPEEEIKALRARWPEKQVLVKSPSIQTDAELASFVRKLSKNRFGAVCSNLGALNAAAGEKTLFWAGSELNVFNSLAAKLLLDLGAEAIVPSVECSLHQLAECRFRDKLVPLVFFYPALLTSKAYAKAGGGKNFSVKDRKGYSYKAIFDGSGIVRVYNPVPVDMLFELEDFAEFAAIGIDLSNCTTEEASGKMKILAEKKNGMRPSKTSPFTRGHYKNELK